LEKLELKTLDESLLECPDIIRKKVLVDGGCEAWFFFIGAMADMDLVQRDFIRPILAMPMDKLTDPDVILKLPCKGAKLLYDNTEMIENILAGNTVFFCEELPLAISCALTDKDKRNIEEPIVEKNIRGPHEGFIELLETNLSILRRKIKNDRLKFKILTLGEQTHQKVAIAFMEGIANREIVDGLYKKISEIEIDGLLAVGYVEQFINSHPYSIFPQFLSTERPDRAMAALLEGRIVVLQEGTPVVLIAPVNFISFFQALDDYSTSWIHGSFLRMVRVVALVIAVTFPSLYIAVTSFHYYVVPLDLLITLAESRSRVPFPPVIEVLVLEAIVEMIREAAVRLPTYIGTAISVFASLVIGTAVVEAGIVSNILIIIVAASAVASYVIPSFDMSMAIRILRFAFTFAAAVFGIIGIVICAGMMLVHLVCMESLGQPYFEPLSPFVGRELKDLFVRFPLTMLKKRPRSVKTENRYREGARGRQ
jgi:hypothetical protein